MYDVFYYSFQELLSGGWAKLLCEIPTEILALFKAIFFQSHESRPTTHDVPTGSHHNNIVA